ncbi:hypothetical protein PR202_gb07561 [Eleusine coracana subsp. coracana]|uniref:inositol-1,3,4-trisphosphate 5/6-kinase n=1 Tax=Eleusine coracana subsp. coracana TaxID=191504 RepID=A0AAV5ECH9_ELECO|nr:hypothetical protein PR202_gb07561 [Eleusine coracana subsp. coracana]
MLQVVSELEHAPLDHHRTFGIPSQVVVYDADALADSGLLAALRFPLIAKPLVADGTAKSHKMSLVYHREGLRKLRPPLVLQEFVNHGGVIFKVYVVGGPCHLRQAPQPARRLPRGRRLGRGLRLLLPGLQPPHRAHRRGVLRGHEPGGRRHAANRLRQPDRGWPSPRARPAALQLRHDPGRPRRRPVPCH